ncbi:MAG: ABC transporter permease [Christensenellales bacterium]
MKKRSAFAPVYLTLVILLMYLPILVVVLYSFNGNSSRNAAITFQGFSLQWYEGIFSAEKGYRDALLTSLRIALISVGASSLLGTLGAVGLLRRDMKKSLLGRVGHAALGLSEQLTMLPIMIPEIILGIAFLALFGAMGLPFGELTLVLSHISFCVPYIFITVKSRLSSLDPALNEAARDLGASPARAFLTVTLPLIMPAVVSGALLAFAMSMDDFVISFFVNGAQTTTLPLKVYSSVKVGVTPSVNALCTVMLGMAFLLFALGQLVSSAGLRRRGRREAKMGEAGI